MKNIKYGTPAKIMYNVLIGFCLMSILPILVGFYVVMLFVPSIFEGGHQTIVAALVCLLSLTLSILGYFFTRQLLMPIPNMTTVARKIAEGKLDNEELPTVSGASEEIQELTRSLTMISKNAKELLEKVDKLSLRDKLTGLYNAHYIRERLDEEIDRAIHYQQPCSFAYLLLHNYDAYLSKHGEKETEEALKEIATLLKDNLREFDRAARVGRGEFAIIFPDQNKKKVMGLAEKIGREILERRKFLSCIGISENPIDGVHADGLFVKAQDRMKTAKQNGTLLEAFA